MTTAFIFILSFTLETKNRFEKISLKNLRSLPEVVIDDKVLLASPRQTKCSYWNCFNVYNCGQNGNDRISVYVYPLRKYVDTRGMSATDTISQEFYAVLKTIVESKYYTPDPTKACLFVPSIDTLSQIRFKPNITSQAFNTLPYWRDGENHLLFNMLPGDVPLYSTVMDVNVGKAIIAGAGFDSWTYRTGFDVSLPVFSPLAKQAESRDEYNVRSWLVISTQINIDPDYKEEMRTIAASHNEVLLLDACSASTNLSVRCAPGTKLQYTYPDILRKSTFCLVFRGTRLAQPLLLEAMAADCIPVIVADTLIMPFHNVLDWKRAAIFIMEENLADLMEVLKSVSDEHVVEMQNQIRWLYEQYFSSMEKIAMTTLDIIQDRVYPQWAKMYEGWNIAPLEKTSNNPLFLPLTAPRSQGFTAVILTYDRLESLFILVEKLSKVPSLMKVLVVWNNQKKVPPPESEWPKINKPVKVIRTKANKLSNRFYPYEEIETEAILTIDDDIVMLTSDELEFGYEVWREFPDRIVGFPSRTHIWDNVTQSWRYESEWTNEISMVLTGAAFHHKYWSFMYTTALPVEIRDWVDDHMNCEDIAMNFLVANITNKPPIKVAPRKKFKCPECTNTEMLSADLSHMAERSQCVDRFARVYGSMPLKSVEFRADPVLYKDLFPEKLKRFNDIGSL